MAISRAIRRRARMAATVAVAILVAAAGRASAAAEDQQRSVWEGVYTAAQAADGEQVFLRQCIACHANQPGAVAGHGPAPSLIGEDFSFRWTDASIADLYDSIRQTMPEAAPNSLSAAEYAAVTAYLLKLNAYPAGTTAIDHGRYADLQRILIDADPPVPGG